MEPSWRRRQSAAAATEAADRQDVGVGHCLAAGQTDDDRAEQLVLVRQRDARERPESESSGEVFHRGFGNEPEGSLDRIGRNLNPVGHEPRKELPGHRRAQARQVLAERLGQLRERAIVGREMADVEFARARIVLGDARDSRPGRRPDSFRDEPVEIAPGRTRDQFQGQIIDVLHDILLPGVWCRSVRAAGSQPRAVGFRLGVPDDHEVRRLRLRAWHLPRHSNSACSLPPSRRRRTVSQFAGTGFLASPRR